MKQKIAQYTVMRVIVMVPIVFQKFFTKHGQWDEILGEDL